MTEGCCTRWKSTVLQVEGSTFFYGKKEKQRLPEPVKKRKISSRLFPAVYVRLQEMMD
jgi:hypothetical protein